MRTNKLILIIISFTIILQSCNLIWICNENKSSIKKSYKYKNQIGITVAELKEMLETDSTHFKYLIFYSPCCGPCVNHMTSTYRNAYEKKDSTIKFYFVNESCGGLRYNENFIQQYGFNEKLYFIRDTTFAFSIKNIERYNNILNYLFQDNSNYKITGTFGIPISCITSKNNELKKTICKYEKDTTIHYIPLPIHSLQNFDIQSINFNIIDTINKINYNYCTPNGCY